MHALKRFGLKIAFTLGENFQRILCRSNQNFYPTAILGFTSWIADAMESIKENQRKRF